MNLVREVDGRYVNMNDVERYLVKGSRTYFGDYLTYIVRRDYADGDNVADNLTAVANNHRSDERSYLNYLQDPEEARRFTVAGYEASIGLAHKLAKKYDFSRFGRWLDIAGGSGSYAIAARERNPKLQVTVMDQPNVIVVAQEFIAKHGLEARIGTMAGNFLETPFPTDYDLASYITPLQGYMPDEIIPVLRRTQEALKPGGEILIIDYMLEDDKTGPLDPAFVNLAGGNSISNCSHKRDRMGVAPRTGWARFSLPWYRILGVRTQLRNGPGAVHLGGDGRLTGQNPYQAVPAVGRSGLERGDAVFGVSV